MSSLEQHYKILGLSPDADKPSIKKAYRQLAMQYHPDKNPEAKERFLRIVEAYEVLMGVRAQQKKKPVYSAREMEVVYETLQKRAREKAREKLKKKAAQKRQQKAEEQAREYSKAIYTLLGLVVLGFSVYYAYDWFFQLMLNRDKQTTVATVVGVQKKRIVYEFEVEGKRLKESAYVNAAGMQMLAKTGLPLKIGNQFQLEYSAQNPKYHKINYQKVSKETLQYYFKICEPPVYLLYRDKWSSYTEQQKKIRTQCLILLTYQKLGLEGLAQLYFHQENPLENFSNNRWSWHFFKDSEEFVEIQNLCESPL